MENYKVTGPGSSEVNLRQEVSLATAHQKAALVCRGGGLWGQRGQTRQQRGDEIVN